MSAPTPRPPKVLAVASAGGHWHQLMQMTPAFDGAEVTFAATDPDLAEVYGLERMITLRDYNKKDPVGVARGLVQTFGTLARLRPDVVVSTGAAPGLLCLLWGRLFGARTIWIDSIANSAELSLSGRLALRFCHVVVTQWEHLATGNPKLTYWGSVL